MIDLKKCNLSKIPRREILRGTKVEMEHTNNPYIAKRIAEQHLCEFPTYYKELIKMERRLSKK